MILKKYLEEINKNEKNIQENNVEFREFVANILQISEMRVSIENYCEDINVYINIGGHFSYHSEDSHEFTDMEPFYLPIENLLELKEKLGAKTAKIVDDTGHPRVLSVSYGV